MILDFKDHKNRIYRLSEDLAETDSPYRGFSHLQPLFDEASHFLRRKDKRAEKKLQQYIEENPGVPQLKNYLTVYYSLQRRNDKAFAYNHQIAAEHPDYLFAKINLALEYITRNEPGKVEEILGPQLELQEVYPERKTFHVTEYVNFYKVVFRYRHLVKQMDRAREILADLIQLEEKLDDDFDLEEFSAMLMSSALEKMQQSITRQKELAGIVRLAPTFPQTTAAPAFHFLQIQWLYENSFAIEKGKIDELLGLERDLLINDLSEVIYDAIRRYTYFSEKEYEPETHDFILHALVLLQELEAQEAFPAVLTLLRQPEELLDYWLSDLITESLWQVVYATGKNNLSALENYLKEPLNYPYARSAVSTAISQLVLHQPERREEVITLYKSLLNFYYDNRYNREIFDGTLIAFIAGDIADFNGRELMDEMKRFYDEGLADEFIEGNWEEVLERLETNDADKKFSRKRKLQNITENIKELRDFECRVENDEEEDEDEDYDDFDEEDDFLDYEEVNTEGGTVVYSGDEPYKREEKKIGRNDPRPCGSGLKYKKCHGKST